tara:strand:+ start:895 stop:1377 length:483 start_codon:yes stop_codon:yes gene_type:complete
MQDTKDVLNEDKISDATKKDALLNSEEINVKIDEIKDIFNKVSTVAHEVGLWSESTIQLFFTEVLRNVAAAKQLFVCQLLFIPLLVLFIFSLCVCVGIITYSLTESLLIGVGLFILAMLLVLVGLIYWQKYLLRFFGFKATVSQLKEGFDVISKASKSFD